MHAELQEIEIVTLARLDTVVPLRHGLGLVVDARNTGEVPVTILARLVRIRRVLRRIGGDLALAADEETIAALRRTGLAFALPCRRDVSQAVQLLMAQSSVVA